MGKKEAEAEQFLQNQIVTRYKVRILAKASASCHDEVTGVSLLT